MTKLYCTYKWILIAGILCYSTSSFAFHHDQDAQPASWGRTTTFSDDVRPTYTFRTTSAYSPIVGNTSYLSDGSGPVNSPSRAKAWSPWDDPDDDPMGTVPAVPVGEPLVLLVMALAYILCRRTRLRKIN